MKSLSAASGNRKVDMRSLMLLGEWRKIKKLSDFRRKSETKIRSLSAARRRKKSEEFKGC